MNRHISDLCAFLDASPVNFFAADTVRQRLEEKGFSRLDMRDSWSLKPGDRRYVLVNGSAIFAFVAGAANPAKGGFHIIAAHSDSPGFRIKPACEMASDGGVVRLNTEGTRAAFCSRAVSGVSAPKTSVSHPAAGCRPSGTSRSGF